MKCQLCSEEATVHLTQIIAGKMQKIDLCEKCAKAKGVSDPTGFSLADMLLGLGASETMKAGGDPDELVCRECGFTQPDFKKTGRMGCPNCYSAFSEGLGILLKDMHKGTSHKGKIPARYQETTLFRERLRGLQAELQQAVKEEKYELAASLRDQIQQLQMQIKA